MSDFGKNPSLPPLLYEAQRRTLTVGGPGADIPGFHSGALQMAADLLRLNGGVIQLEAGIYDMLGPVRLWDDTTLRGVGVETVLRKVDGVSSRLALDADYAELVATVEDAAGFQPGMGISVTDADNGAAWKVSTAILTAVEGNTLYFDRYLEQDYREDRAGRVSNACSLIEAKERQRVTIADLSLDGNAAKNDPLDSCRGGGIYLHKVRDCLVEHVTLRDFNGDGISWQTSYHVTLRGCEVSGCTRNGIHPGAGTYYATVEDCDIHHNGGDGLFICWRVKEGVFRRNHLHYNQGSGLNIGHRDTDNRIEENRCEGNAVAGIHLRPEKPANAPHRVLFLRNTLANNGGEAEGCGMLMESAAEDVRIEENLFENAGQGRQRIGILRRQPMPGLQLRENRFQGCEEEITEA